jgi:hypothetical protein
MLKFGMNQNWPAELIYGGINLLDYRNKIRDG